MLQDFLPGRNVSWNALYRHGKLVAAAAMERKSYVLGGQTVIGAGSVIGGNVWLTESVPPGSRVMANPPRNVVSPGQGDTQPLSLQLPWDE